MPHLKIFCSKTHIELAKQLEEFAKDVNVIDFVSTDLTPDLGCYATAITFVKREVKDDKDIRP